MFREKEDYDKPIIENKRKGFYLNLDGETPDDE